MPVVANALKGLIWITEMNIIFVNFIIAIVTYESILSYQRGEANVVKMPKDTVTKLKCIS